MPNKYIRHGETYCGDGTTSAAAASNGGVGAWNNIGIYEGNAPSTYGGTGVVAAGDTVYIRSKDAGGNDITRTLAASATLGSSAATTSAWITWVIDGGTIWSGIDGTVTYECPSTYTITLRSYNYYRAENPDKLYIKETNTNADYKKICTFPSSCLSDNVFIDCSLNGHATGNWMEFAEQENIHYNLHLKWAKHYASPLSCKQWSKLTLYNPSIELTVSDTQSPLVKLGAYGSCCTTIGGRVFGTGATTNNTVVGVDTGGSSGKTTFIGTRIPKEMKMLSNATTPDGPWKIEATGIDAYAGSYTNENWGETSSREDKYYPTRTAFLPDSVSTPWSVWCYPSNASLKNQIAIPIAKLFTDTAAAKTITAELLVADSITTANKETMWLDVSYIDNSTGLPTTVSSRVFGGGALDTSSVSWSARTYGETGLSKKKFSVTTPTSIKQNSMVTATLRGTWKSASANDFFILCPDLDLT